MKDFEISEWYSEDLVSVVKYFSSLEYSNDIDRSLLNLFSWQKLSNLQYFVFVKILWSLVNLRHLFMVFVVDAQVVMTGEFVFKKEY